MRIANSLTLVAAAALLAACGGDPAPRTDGAGKVTGTYSIPDGQGGQTQATVQEKGDQTTLTFEGAEGAGAITMGGGAAPRDLPAYAPVYPGAKIVSSMAGSSTEGGGGMVALETPDAPEKVLAFYEGKLAGSGLPQTMKSQSGAGTMLALSDEATGQGVQVSITPGPSGGAMVTIAYSNPKP
jgi:hypothetical protein